MYMILMPLSIFKLALEPVPTIVDVESGVANRKNHSLSAWECHPGRSAS